LFVVEKKLLKTYPSVLLLLSLCGESFTKCLRNQTEVSASVYWV